MVRRTQHVGKQPWKGASRSKIAKLGDAKVKVMVLKVQSDQHLASGNKQPLTPTHAASVPMRLRNGIIWLPAVD